MDKRIVDFTKIAQSFIYAQYGQANSMLAESLDVIGLEKLSGEVLPILQLIIEAQERKDYLYVADLLQYELAPKLGIAQ